jgi:hypothetical protein
MKRAQAALEYLMTYGWAILIIAIVAAALYYMNVFGGACSPSATGFQTHGGVTVLTGDYLVYDDGSASVKIKNTAGQSITVSNMLFNCASGCTTTDHLEVISQQIASGGDYTLSMGAASLSTATAGTCFRISLQIRFTTASLPGSVQTSTGTIQGAYQAT